MYLSYLKSLPGDAPQNISATSIADAMNLNQVQVRKDLAAVSSSGRPRVGYVRQDLIREIEQFLGYDAADDAVIAGAGKLGKALLDYKGFKDYGLNILAAFDVDERIVGTELNGKPILHISKIQDTCRRLNIRIGIITVPVEYAQMVCDQFVESGVLAVWNFAPVHLKVPEHILVQNENMAASLAVLSNHLKAKIAEKPAV